MIPRLFRLTALLLLACALAPALPASAQQEPAGFPSAGDCLAQAFAEMGRQQRLYRVVLLGRKRAEKAKPSEIRYDADGDPWIKTRANTWQTIVEGKEEEILSDAEMDARLETDATWETPFRPGIVETPQAVTSELIPAMLTSVRALRCRTKAVCAAVRESFVEEPSDPLEGDVPGCLPLETYALSPFEACRFVRQGSYVDPTAAVASCREAAELTVQREMDLLKALVGYDAGYRTLLQFAGTMDNFAQEFKFSLLQPLWETIAVFRQISRIPCFLSACEP